MTYIVIEPFFYIILCLKLNGKKNIDFTLNIYVLCGRGPFCNFAFRKEALNFFYNLPLHFNFFYNIINK